MKVPLQRDECREHPRIARVGSASRWTASDTPWAAIGIGAQSASYLSYSTRISSVVSQCDESRVPGSRRTCQASRVSRSLAALPDNTVIDGEIVTYCPAVVLRFAFANRVVCVDASQGFKL